MRYPTSPIYRDVIVSIKGLKDDYLSTNANHNSPYLNPWIQDKSFFVKIKGGQISKIGMHIFLAVRLYEFFFKKSPRIFLNFVIWWVRCKDSQNDSINGFSCTRSFQAILNSLTMFFLVSLTDAITIFSHISHLSIASLHAKLVIRSGQIFIEPKTKFI